MIVAKICTILAILSACSGENCVNGNCHLDDYTNLLQYSQSVTSGSKHQDPKAIEQPAEDDGQEPKEMDEPAEDGSHAAVGATAETLSSGTQEEAQSEMGEKFMLEGEGGENPIKPGCKDFGCYGDGPNCGGSELECTSRGLIVAGYYKSCGWSTCRTGYKVRCMACPTEAKAKPAPYPKPAPSPAVWTEPPPAPTPAPGPTPKPPKAPTLPNPTGLPVFAAPKYDPGAIGNATLALKRAEALLKELECNATKARATESAVRENITKFEKKAEDAEAEFHSNRDAAVRFAKKRELANITAFKAQVSMNSAYFAQKGAEKGAHDSLAEAKNYNAQRRYYEKLLVDKRYDTTKARRNFEIGHAAIQKADYDLSHAKKLKFDHQSHVHLQNKRVSEMAEEGTEMAEEVAVKHSMEHAYIDSSVSRNESNIPPWGDHWAYWA